MTKKFKSGFVAIVGMANVGKSTLLNALAGQKIAIVSDKPQTTRNRILAIYNDKDCQIVFTDTPGMHKPHNKLGEVMVKSVSEAINDVDIVVFTADATKKITASERELIAEIEKSGADKLLVINKTDLVKKEELLPIIADYSSLGDFKAIVPMSAKTGDGVEILLQELKQNLPEGPKYYDDESVTDQQERQIAAEIIREKLLRFLDKEVPHGIEMLKKVATRARYDIEKMLDKKVYLELWVRVKDDWRNSEKMIKSFGFEI